MVALVALAGCAKPPTTDDGNDPPTEPVPIEWTSRPLEVPCSSCFEPTLAHINGTWFVSTAIGTTLYRSDDGKNWTGSPRPPLPFNGPTSGFYEADITLFSDESSLYYLSLVVTGQSPAILFLGIHVARSDDLGATWAANTFLGPASGEEVQAERAWLTVVNETLYVVWPEWSSSLNTPTSTSDRNLWLGTGDGLWVASSSDGGASFSEPVQVAEGRQIFPSPLSASGTVVAFTSGNPDLTRNLHLAVDANGWQVTDLGEGSVRFPTIVETDRGLWLAVSQNGRTTLHALVDDVWADPVVLEGTDHAPSSWLAERPGGGVDLAYSVDRQLRILRFEAGAMFRPDDPGATIIDLDVHAPVDTDFMRFHHIDDRFTFLASDAGGLYLVTGPA